MSNDEKKPAKSVKTLSWVTTLYYAQGLPFSIVRQVSVYFFKKQGVGLSYLGLTSFYGIPWTFKFLWGPFVDQFSTKRRWILLLELLLAGTLALVGLAVFHGEALKLVAVLFLIVAFVAATHDIAIDGFYLEALPRDEQAKYSGLWQMGYRLALLTGSGLLIGVSGKLPWWLIFTAVSVLFLLIRLWHAFILPKPDDPVTKAGSTQIIPVIQSFQAYLQLPGIGLAMIFIVLFKIGDALLFGMSTPFLDDLGVRPEQLGLISGGLGTVSAIAATICGGWFISKYSLRRGLYIFGFIQNLAIPAYAFVAWAKPNIYIIAATVSLEQICAGLGSSAYANFAMRQINPKYRASHYAISTSLMSLTTMLSGAISGFGAQKYGYYVFFLMAFVASLPGLVLIPFVARRSECQ